MSWMKCLSCWWIKSITAVAIVLVFSITAQAAKWTIQVDVCEATNGSNRVTSKQPGQYASKSDCESAAQDLLNLLKSTNMKIFYIKCARTSK